MQSLARSMLQELQCQGASQEGAGSGGSGDGDDPGAGRGLGIGAGGSGAGRGVAAVSDAESETSFPFPTTHFSAATASSPFFNEGPRAPRADSTRGDGGEVEGSSTIRSGVGGRSPPPPTFASTLETIGPPLLAKSQWIDANAPLPTPDSVEKYRTVQRASTTAQLLTLLSSSPAPPLQNIPSPLVLISEAPLLVETTANLVTSDESPHSDSSFSTTASKASTASSFPSQMRHNFPDMRLLRQKSKPPQHTIQKASILKLPGDIKRSPTLFGPKLISDTAILVVRQVARPSLAPSASKPHQPSQMPRTDSFIQDPVREMPTLALPNIQLSKKLPPLPSAEKVERPGTGLRQPITSSKDFAHVRSFAAPDSVTRQLRFETPTTGSWRKEESPCPSVERSRKSSAERSRRSSTSAQQTYHRHKKHYHAVTPPEEEPRVKPLHHGDSYFETFHTLSEATSKDFVPAQTPQPREQPKKEDHARRRPESEPVPLNNARPSILATHVKTPSETAAVMILKRGKQGSKLGFFRKYISDSSEQDLATPLDASFSTPITPSVQLNTSEDIANKRRVSSVVPEMQTQSYFNRPRVRRLPSDNSLSPTGVATPVTVFSDESPSPLRVKSRVRHQDRSSSDQLSPMGTPRARHRPTMESLRSRVSQATMNSTPASQTDVRRIPTDKSDKKSSVKSTAKGKRKGSVKFVDQTDTARTDPLSLDLNQVTLKSKPSNYFVDIRKVSSTEQLLSDGRPPSETKGTRRWSLMPKLSSLSLSRISMSHLSSLAAQRLHRKSSQVSNLAQESSSGKPKSEMELSPPPSPALKGSIQPSIPIGRRFSAAQLEVTEFEQTPFSQRYHDAERTLQQQIRAFVEEGLNEVDDAEGDNELVLGFEQDVPDHFPNSPLCPLHPKHKSGGKAICPLHGRYKKGMPPPTQLIGKRPVGRVSTSGVDPHAGHHRIEIVLDTAVVEQPSVKEGRPTSVDIFGVVKEDYHNNHNVSVLGTDGTVSTRIRAAPLYAGSSDMCRGRGREREICGSERKRRRRARMR